MSPSSLGLASNGSNKVQQFAAYGCRTRLCSPLCTALCDQERLRMYFVTLFIFMIVSVGLAFDELKTNHTKLYQQLSGEKTLFSPLSRIGLIGYFIAFEYYDIWSSLGPKKYVFLSASLFSWSFIVYVMWKLIQQVIT